MATIWDRTGAPEATCERVARPRRDERDDCWARIAATSGAGVWAALAVFARAGIVRLGGIELLFLLAPLVFVPLGIALGRALEVLSTSLRRPLCSREWCLREPMRSLISWAAID